MHRISTVRFLQTLTGMDEENTLLHAHRCKNCGTEFPCSDPLCDGSWLDPELCPECEEALKGIWYPL